MSKVLAPTRLERLPFGRLPDLWRPTAADFLGRLRA
jgi:hypothetical protein